MARCREATRYWTQSEMNTRLVDLSGLLLFNRLFAIALAHRLPRLHLVALLDDRARALEAPPAQARQARRGRRRSSPPFPPRSTAGASSRAPRSPSRLVQFLTRLRVEVRQVLTSPGLIVLALFAIGNAGAGLWLGQATLWHQRSPDARRDDRHRPRRRSARS